MKLTTLLSRKEAAETLGISAHTLAIWSTKSFGPPTIKIGSRAKYDESDLAKFIESRKRASTSAPFAETAA